MIRGVLFDMDGVLLDTERLGFGIIPQAARDMGYDYPAALYDRMMGLNRQASCAVYREVFGADFPAQELEHRFFGKLLDIARSGALPLKKGFQECMDGLGIRRIPCALATGSDRAVVEAYQQHTPALQGHFRAMICGAEATRSKPEPDIYRQAAAGLGLKPEECLGVEDSRNGVRSLRAARCHSVMIPDLLAFGAELAPYVDTVLNDLTELCPLIDRLNGRG